MIFENLKPGDKFYLTQTQAEKAGKDPLKVWTKRREYPGQVGNAHRMGVDLLSQVETFEPETEVTTFRLGWELLNSK